MGHPSSHVLRLRKHTKKIYVTTSTQSFRSDCWKAKNHKLSFSTSTSRATAPLELIHYDVWGPPPVVSNKGNKYSVHFDQRIQLMVRQHMASSLRECSSRLLPPCFLRSNSYLGFLAYSALSSLGLTIPWWIIWCHSRNHPFLLRWYRSSILVKAACSNHALFIE